VTGQVQLPAELDGISKLRAGIASAYFPYDIVELARGSDIVSTAERRRFGPLRVSRLTSNASYRGRRPASSRRNDCFVLHLMQEGNVSLTQNCQTVDAEPGSLVLISPDIMLESEKHGMTDAIAVLIPAQLLTMHFPDAREWSLSVRPTSFGMPAILRDNLESSWRQRDLISGSEGVRLSKALIHLIGATFGREDPHLYACGSRSMQMHYMRIRELVIQNIDNDELSADFVTNRLGISKSYLFAILKQSNTRLSRLILELRLERCREILADPEMARVSISEIAYSMGFRELPHFSRCFTKFYGVSARSFRTAQHARGLEHLAEVEDSTGDADRLPTYAA
jgi:AraC family transcriptional activator of tynA and feaB